METRPTEIKYRSKDDDDAPEAAEESKARIRGGSMSSGSIIDHDGRSRLRCTQSDLFDW